jgi:hypothetical protein
VVALSGGFGVFAVLRVNHEPLSRLPSATAPLQLAPDNVAGPAVISGGQSPASAPETATAFAEEPLRESARNDGGETPAFAPRITDPEAVASVTDEKTQAATQPDDPPMPTSPEFAAADRPAAAAEAKPVPAATDGSDAPAAQGETAVAAAGDEAKANKPAEPTSEPAPIATRFGQPAGSDRPGLAARPGQVARPRRAGRPAQFARSWRSSPPC